MAERNTGTKNPKPKRLLLLKAKPPLDRPRGFQEAEVPRLHDNRHMKMISLSARRTGRLYPRKYSWCSFLLEAESTPGP